MDVLNGTNDNVLSLHLKGITNEKPTLFMMIGISGSGKSTYAQKVADEYVAKIVSSDAIRKEIFGDENVQDHNDIIFQTYNSDIATCLRSGYDVIADATNLTYKSRKATFNAIKDIDCRVVALIQCTPLKDCLDMNSERERTVPNNVIIKQIKCFQIPFFEEGFDEIVLCNKETTPDHSYWKKIDSIMYRFNQNSPYHTQTLWSHSETVAKNFHISFVAYYHDVGKIFTEEKDDNGISHYYNHANVGTYVLLTKYHPNIKDEDIYNYVFLYNLFLVNYHMLPFDWKTDKARNKWRGIFGEEKYADLMMLHEADLIR